MKSKPPTPVIVTWIDSVQTLGWGELHSPSDMECASVGFLVNKTKDRITLALNWDGSEHGMMMEIPRVAVKRVKKLR